MLFIASKFLRGVVFPARTVFSNVMLKPPYRIKGSSLLPTWCEHPRYFAAPATSSTSSSTSSDDETTSTATSDRYAELVKETIKKMILERDDKPDYESKPISDDELQGKFNYYKVCML
jgi:hypothetical protein